MKLKNARLCLDCEEIFDYTENKNIFSCPLCGRSESYFIEHWINTILGNFVSINLANSRKGVSKNDKKT
jgi:anaerobic ribonucleoside-triphosphate reductase